MSDDFDNTAFERVQDRARRIAESRRPDPEADNSDATILGREDFTAGPTLAERGKQAFNRGRAKASQTRAKAQSVASELGDAADAALGEPAGGDRGLDLVGGDTEPFDLGSDVEPAPLDPAAGLGDDGGGDAAGSLAPEAGLDDLGGGGPNSGLDLDPADIDPFEERR